MPNVRQSWDTSIIKPTSGIFLWIISVWFRVLLWLEKHQTMFNDASEPVAASPSSPDQSVSNLQSKKPCSDQTWEQRSIEHRPQVNNTHSNSIWGQNKLWIINTNIILLTKLYNIPGNAYSITMQKNQKSNIQTRFDQIVKLSNLILQTYHIVAWVRNKDWEFNLNK